MSPRPVATRSLRHAVRPRSLDGPQYLAIYEVDIDDPQNFFDDMMRAATDGSMRMSDASWPELVGLTMWEEITPRVS